MVVVPAKFKWAVSANPAIGEKLTVWFVYLLINDKKISYTGIAMDVDDRLRRHNMGSGAKFTRGRGPWRVIHMEGPLSHGDALRREAVLRKDRRFKEALKSEAG